MKSTAGTECPKCGARCGAGTVECPRCGIVFAKLDLRRSSLPDTYPFTTEAPNLPPLAVGPLRTLSLVGRALLLLALAWWTWRFAGAPMDGVVIDSVLHLPNLVFHEAGHVLLSVFGHFMTVLGGSLFQLLVPVTLAIALLRRRDPFGASVCGWWAGQNLVDLAPYIADARALQLVLLGGRTGAEVEGHDWEYLLTEMGWLHLDRTLGMTAHWLGIVIMTGALIWGCVVIHRKAKTDPANGPAFD